MNNLSFFEKLKIFVDVASSSKIYIIAIFALIFLAFIFLTVNKKNAKATKLLFIGLYVLSIIAIIVLYKTSLKSMVDYMMNNFFIVFYFPNVAIYLGAIIITNIILWFTIFNYKEDKLLKVINTFIFCIMHYFLVLILNIVHIKKLDIFDQSSIYGNEQVAALISLSSIVFIVWLLFLLIYKFIRATQKKEEVEKVITKYVKVPLKKNIAGIVEITPPVLVKKVVDQKQATVTLEEKMDIDQKLIKEYENMLTLDDYKLVLDILKNNQDKTNMINIEDEVEDSKDDFSEEVIVQTEQEINEDDFIEEEDSQIKPIITYNSVNNRTKLDELLNI